MICSWLAARDRRGAPYVRRAKVRNGCDDSQPRRAKYEHT